MQFKPDSVGHFTVNECEEIRNLNAYPNVVNYRVDKDKCSPILIASSN